MIKNVLKDTAVLTRHGGYNDYGQPIITDDIEIKCVKFEQINPVTTNNDITYHTSTTVITDALIQLNDKIDGRPIGAIKTIKTARAKIIGYEVVLT